jgi:hypothetical protein
VHGNRSPVSAWVALIAVAAMLGVGLAGATFIRLEGQGEVLDTWGAPVVTFTLAYSAVVGALAGALAGLLPFLWIRAGLLGADGDCAVSFSLPRHASLVSPSLQRLSFGFTAANGRPTSSAPHFFGSSPDSCSTSF